MNNLLNINNSDYLYKLEEKLWRPLIISNDNIRSQREQTIICMINFKHASDLIFNLAVTYLDEYIRYQQNNDPSFILIDKYGMRLIGMICLRIASGVLCEYSSDIDSDIFSNLIMIPMEQCIKHVFYDSVYYSEHPSLNKRVEGYKCNESEKEILYCLNGYLIRPSVCFFVAPNDHYDSNGLIKLSHICPKLSEYSSSSIGKAINYISKFSISNSLEFGFSNLFENPNLNETYSADQSTINIAHQLITFIKSIANNDTFRLLLSGCDTFWDSVLAHINSEPSSELMHFGVIESELTLENELSNLYIGKDLKENDSNKNIPSVNIRTCQHSIISDLSRNLRSDVSVNKIEAVTTINGRSHYCTYALKTSLAFYSYIPELACLSLLSSEPTPKNIINLHDFCYKHYFDAFTMEESIPKLSLCFDCASCTLTSFVKTMTPSKTVQMLPIIFKDLISGVKTCHDNDIIHRDLKPNNVMFIEDRFVLIDFDNSVTFSSFRKSLDPNLASSIIFRAPEALYGSVHYDYKIDIWALGHLFYFVINKEDLYNDCGSINDVLNAMFSLFGFPCDEEWPKVYDLPFWQNWDSEKIRYKNYFNKPFFKEKLGEYYDLVMSCFVMNPKKRADTKQLLKLLEK